ncbi:MAG: helix-turn-helix domain-containing protein [Candidatus Micrarchaeota archaeon]
MRNILEDKEEIIELYKKSKDAKEKTKYHALSIIALGYSIIEVSKIFFVDEDTVRNWIRKYLEEKSVKDKERQDFLWFRSTNHNARLFIGGTRKTPNYLVEGV